MCNQGGIFYKVVLHLGRNLLQCLVLGIHEEIRHSTCCVQDAIFFSTSYCNGTSFHDREFCQALASLHPPRRALLSRFSRAGRRRCIRILWMNENACTLCDSHGKALYGLCTPRDVCTAASKSNLTGLRVLAPRLRSSSSACATTAY
jgi:hypothetical protein